MLSAERQSAQMSKITNGGLTRSGTDALQLYTYGNSGHQRVNNNFTFYFLFSATMSVTRVGTEYHEYVTESESNHSSHHLDGLPVHGWSVYIGRRRCCQLGLTSARLCRRLVTSTRLSVLHLQSSHPAPSTRSPAITDNTQCLHNCQVVSVQFNKGYMR